MKKSSIILIIMRIVTQGDMMKFILFFTLLLVVACNSDRTDPTEDTPDSNVPSVENIGVPVIFDNDFGFSDPDNDGALKAAIALHKNQDINLLAIGRVGTDTANNGILIPSAQLKYHGLDIPIGINTTGKTMRVATTVGSSVKPLQSSEYVGDKTDIREFDTTAKISDVVELYMNALRNSDRKVAIASGGQLYNIAELLLRDKQLVADKVSMITFLGRDSINTLGGQNFGGQDDYAKWALDYIIANLPSNVPFIECMTDAAYPNYQTIPNSRIGQIYTKHDVNSPIAFVYGLEHPYGVGLIDGYSIIDMLPLVYAAYGTKLPDGTQISNLVGATFTSSRSISTTANGRDFKLESNVTQWGQIKNNLEALLLSTEP